MYWNPDGKLLCPHNYLRAIFSCSLSQFLFMVSSRVSSAFHCSSIKSYISSYYFWICLLVLGKYFYDKRAKYLELWHSEDQLNCVLRSNMQII